MIERKIFSLLNPPPSPSVKFEDASLTRQEFLKDADINNIMAKYASGVVPLSSGARTPFFGDFSNVPDYQTSLQVVIDAQERFAQLPSQLRNRFENDPAKLLEFLAVEENRAEAISLGLIDPPPVKVAVDNSSSESVPAKGAE